MYYSIKGFWSNGTSLIKVIKIFYRSNCVAPFIIILSIRWYLMSISGIDLGSNGGNLQNLYQIWHKVWFCLGINGPWTSKLPLHTPTWK